MHHRSKLCRRVASQLTLGVCCNVEEGRSCAARHSKRKALKAFLHKLRHAPATPAAAAASDATPASTLSPGMQPQACPSACWNPAHCLVGTLPFASFGPCLSLHWSPALRLIVTLPTSVTGTLRIASPQPCLLPLFLTLSFPSLEPCKHTCFCYQACPQSECAHLRTCARRLHDIQTCFRRTPSLVVIDRSGSTLNSRKACPCTHTHASVSWVGLVQASKQAGYTGDARLQAA